MIEKKAAETKYEGAVWLALVVLPIVFFYSVLFRKAVNVPFSDDYDSILNMLNISTQYHGVFPRWSFAVMAQHNEYRTMLENLIIYADYEIFGHPHIVALCALGNAFILLLAVALWKMFLPRNPDRSLRLALFVPVSWLLFQLSYAETVNWASPGLQNLPILFFSVSTVYLLAQESVVSFAGAQVAMALAIASSGNGLFLVPLGLLMLIRGRRYARVLPWLVTTALMVVIYFHHYDVHSVQTLGGGDSPTMLQSFVDLKLNFIFGFLGSAATIPYPYGGGSYQHGLPLLLPLLLGLLFCVFVLRIYEEGYFTTNPAVAYASLFLIITATGVAIIRSDFGVRQSFANRYRMYSCLALILVWFWIAERYLQDRPRTLWKKPLYLVALAFSIAFSVSMDMIGYRYLVERNRQIVLGITAFEHPTADQPGPQVFLPDNHHDRSALDQNERFNETLRRSIELGIYTPPAY